MNMNTNGNYYLYKDGDRFFWAPFLLGGLGGAALVGLSRPRPVFVNPAPNYYYNPYPYYGGYRPYGYSYGSYGYQY